MSIITGKNIMNVLVVIVCLICPLMIIVSPAEATEGFVTVNGTHFELDGQPFYVAGTNHHYLHYAPEVEVINALEDAAAMGLNALRLWAFLDIGSLDGVTKQTTWSAYGPYAYDCNRQGVYFQYWDTGTNFVAYNDGEDGLRRLDYAVYMAGQYGFKVILSLTNNWLHFGGIPQYLEWFGISNHNDFYTDQRTKTAYKNWVNHLVNRVNYYTGVKYKNDPTIMSWELMNESHADGAPISTVVDWASEMSAFVKQVAPNHLVGLGDEGFFSGRGQDWKYSGVTGMSFDHLAQISTLDWLSYHVYPSWWDESPQWVVNTWIPEHMEVANTIGKPAVIGEFGWNQEYNKEQIYDDWLAEFEEWGGAAWFVWRVIGRSYDDTYPYDSENFDVHYPSSVATALTDAAARMTENNTPPARPESFSLLSPANGATGVDRKPVFTWETSTNATSYTLAVATNLNFSNPVINEDNIRTTSYTPVTTLEGETKYYWKVTACNSIYSTEALNNGMSFTTEAIPDFQLVDNFENYNGSNSALQSKYIPNSSGNTVTVILDDNNKYDGQYGMRFDYTIGYPDFAGVISNRNNENWSDFITLRFWFLPDGSNRTLTIQFRESSGEYWETYHTITGTSALFVDLPLDSFQNPPWFSGGNGVLELASIDQFSVYVNQGSGGTGSSTIYFDRFELTGGSSPVPTPTPGATATPTPEATATPTPTPEPDPTSTPTPDPTPTPTPTPTSSPTPEPGDGILGYDGDGNDGWYTLAQANQGRINACRFQAESNMTLTEMNIKISGDNGAVKLAVYSDDNGSMGSFLRGTEEKTSTQWNWNSFALTSSLTVTGGEYFWLAVWTERGYNCAFDIGGTQGIKEFSYTSDWPAVITGETVESRNLCIYAQ